VTLVFAGTKGGSAAGSAKGGGDPLTNLQECSGAGIQRSATTIRFDAPSRTSG